MSSFVNGIMRITIVEVAVMRVCCGSTCLATRMNCGRCTAGEISAVRSWKNSAAGVNSTS